MLWITTIITITEHRIPSIHTTTEQTTIKRQRELPVLTELLIRAESLIRIPGTNRTTRIRAVRTETEAGRAAHNRAVCIRIRSLRAKNRKRKELKQNQLFKKLFRYSP